MEDDDRIFELVEEALNSQLTAEEVCVQDPRLLAAVKAYLEECRSVASMIEHFFPSTPEGAGPTPTQQASITTFPHYEVLEVLEVPEDDKVGIVYRVRHLRLNRVITLKKIL